MQKIVRVRHAHGVTNLEKELEIQIPNVCGRVNSFAYEFTYNSLTARQ